eukprot:TRINITY_DN242_c1_g1_i4.p2 TRINITY_DN242_c1_g1~~TRINITY_DN242_c1_g1_i4.p2  ORF type:complete len:238 (+),score=-15.59 TRINITY_DN242_c1_g1_i4:231-944(+)
MHLAHIYTQIYEQTLKQKQFYAHILPYTTYPKARTISQSVLPHTQGYVYVVNMLIEMQTNKYIYINKQKNNSSEVLLSSTYIQQQQSCQELNKTKQTKLTIQNETYTYLSLICLQSLLQQNMHTCVVQYNSDFIFTDSFFSSKSYAIKISIQIIKLCYLCDKQIRSIFLFMKCKLQYQYKYQQMVKSMPTLQSSQIYHIQLEQQDKIQIDTSDKNFRNSQMYIVINNKFLDSGTEFT